MRQLFILLLVFIYSDIFSQADNEIQVYASPTIQNKWTIFELHNNYTFNGSKYLANPKEANWFNTSMEITHGLGKNFEMGFYIFSGFAPGDGFEYLGSHIRPRVTVPEEWKWNVGASMSAEFGFFRTSDTSDYIWEGEIRPILDKTIKNWYFSFNPNMAFALTGDDKGLFLTPQFKASYTIKQKAGIGFEYYGDFGKINNPLPGKMQEHLIGPMIDLYLDPMWEINGGFLFGLTENSNQQVFKFILGRRIGK